MGVELANRRAQTQAKANADQEKEAVINEVREEMERELQKMLKMKDEQVRALERKVSDADKLRREQQRELEKQDTDLQAARTQIEELKKSGEGQSGDHRRELDEL